MDLLKKPLPNQVSDFTDWLAAGAPAGEAIKVNSDVDMGTLLPAALVCSEVQVRQKQQRRTKAQQFQKQMRILICCFNNLHSTTHILKQTTRKKLFTCSLIYIFAYLFPCLFRVKCFFFVLNING